MLRFTITSPDRIKTSWLSYCFLIVATLFISFSVTAASMESLQTHSAELDKVDQQLLQQSLKEDKLPEMIKRVTKIKLEMTKCIEEEQAKTDNLKKNLDSLGKALKTDTADVKRKRQELESDILKTEKLLASCRVQLLRTESNLTNLATEQQRLLSERLFAKSSDVIQLFYISWEKHSDWLASGKNFLLKDSGVTLLTLPNLLILFLIITLSWLIGLFIRKQLCRHIDKHMLHDTFSYHFYRSLLSVKAFYAPYLLASLGTALYIYNITNNISPVPLVSVIAYGLPVYFMLVVIVEVFLAPRKSDSSFHGWPEDIARSLCRRLKVFFFLLFTGYIIFTTLHLQSSPENISLLIRSIFILAFVINLVWAVQLIGQIPRYAHTYAIRLVTNVLLVSILIAELLGYRNLSTYAVVSITGSLVSIGLVVLISLLITELFDGLINGQQGWQKYIRNSLGAQARKKLPELSWIKSILIATLWITAIAAILRIWGLSDAGFQQINLVFTEGFTVGSLKIIPARIILAIVVLIILLAFSRWLRAQLERSWLLRSNMERGAREAVATITGYVGVALAIIISLSITGVEFGNLAIIAGALSVGIGFGLQNIVNNFVSGLILLFERPIKTGDWVVVGTTEGFVKRISIRSTQIQTFDKADVIVPNSDLISGHVTNWMLRDVRGRVRVPVGVAYGSDTRLIEKILLEVADENPSVVKDGTQPEPVALFMDFGDSALLFELRVFIKKIDKVFQITSELRFAIDSKFREHGIQIPFPQRDIHIKPSPGTELPGKES